MRKKKEKDLDSEKLLKQHSALVTFTTEEDYYNVDTEKALFSILSYTQIELQKIFAEIYTPYIERLFTDKIERKKILDEIYKTNSSADIDIDFAKIKVKEIPEISKKILKKKIEAAHSVLVDKNKKDKYLLEIEGIDIKQITMKEENSEKLIYQKEELIELLDNIKDVCKYDALNRFGSTKVIDFTSFANKLGMNSKRLKESIVDAAGVKLKFNYINKKKLEIEAMSNLIASIAFTKKKKTRTTWMTYQIPVEILKRLLMPEVYVSLQEKNIHKLEGKYSIRMYSFLKDHVKMGYVKITKEECENFFKLPASYLKNKQHFVHKFLIPTISDIKSKTNLKIEYELIPNYNFREVKFTIYETKEKQEKQEDQNTLDVFETIEISDKVKKSIEKARKNIYVNRVWSKRMNGKIIKMIKEEGEEFTCEVFDDLYDSLKQNIQTTLIQYINGMIKNKKNDFHYKEDLNKKQIEQEMKNEIIDAEVVENDDLSLQKVSSSKKLELEKAFSLFENEKIEELSLQEVSSDETNKSENPFFEKCKEENRIKIDKKYVINKKEYEEQIDFYLKKGNLKSIAAIIVNNMYIVNEED